MAHEVEIRAGRQAIGRPGVGARRVGIGARVVRTREATVADGVAMRAPAFGQVRVERFRRLQVRVDVAVDHRQAGALLDVWRLLKCYYHEGSPSEVRSQKSDVYCRYEKNRQSHCLARLDRPRQCKWASRQVCFPVCGLSLPPGPYRLTSDF